jgi:hypothetical protein
MNRNHALTSREGQSLIAECAAMYARQDAAALADRPTCGGCGNDNAVDGGGVVFCPCCSAFNATQATMNRLGVL